MPDSVNDDPARLLTRQQAARWLSVSLTTLDRLTASKQIDVVRVGASVRITERALEDYTRRHTQRAGARK